MSLLLTSTPSPSCLPAATRTSDSSWTSAMMCRWPAFRCPAAARTTAGAFVKFQIHLKTWALWLKEVDMHLSELLVRMISTGFSVKVMTEVSSHFLTSLTRHAYKLVLNVRFCLGVASNCHSHALGRLPNSILSPCKSSQTDRKLQISSAVESRSRCSYHCEPPFGFSRCQKPVFTVKR